LLSSSNFWKLFFSFYIPELFLTRACAPDFKAFQRLLLGFKTAVLTMSDNQSTASSEGKMSMNSKGAATPDSQTHEASRFTPKSINKRLIVLCDG
jgi:hypothetical protein